MAPVCSMDKLVNNLKSATPISSRDVSGQKLHHNKQFKLRTRFSKRGVSGQKLHSLCSLQGNNGGYSIKHGDDCTCEGDQVYAAMASLEKQGLTQDLTSLLSSLLDKAWGAVNDSATIDLVGECLLTTSWVLGRLPRIVDYSDVLALLDYITRIHFGKNVGKFIFEFAFAGASGLEAQSMDWSVLKDLVSGYAALKTHPAAIKFIKMVSLAFSCGFLAKLGVEASVGDMWSAITECFTRVTEHTDFFAAALDLIHFVGERIAAFCATGSWKTLLHTPSSYERWADGAYDLLDKSVALSNPAAVGLDLHEYLASLARHVTEGREIKKYIRAAKDKDVVSQVLSRLTVLHTEILIRNACAEFRMAPFGLLVHSGSGSGKSSFTNMLLTHYGKLYDKPIGKEYIYTRSAAEDHWNNFKASMWACILDDVAFLNPNKATCDPSISDILQALNNVAFSPPQAALEDKGRTPFLCDIVVATTNREDLMAHAWFNNPQAVRRRLPYIVHIIPKPEYRVDGSNALDVTKVPPTLPGHYDDLWDITVKKVRVNVREEIELDVILQTSNIYEFITEYNGYLAAHRASQAAFMASREATSQVTLCRICLIPETVCPCEVELPLEVQSGEEELTPQAKITPLAFAGCMAAGYGVYRTVKFTGSCMGDVLATDPNLMGHPYLAAATVMRMQQRAKWAIDARVERFRVYTREEVKALLRSALYDVYGHCRPLLRKLLLATGVLAAAGITWHFLKREFPEFVGLDPQVEGSPIDEVGRTPPTQEEDENVWRKDDYVPSEFLGRLSTSWSHLPLSQVTALVGRNVVWCRTTHSTTKHTTFRATCVVGHLYVVPNHVLPTDDYFQIQVIHENNSEGCNGNVTFKMAQNLIWRCPDKELAFFQINHMPVRRDIRAILPLHGAKLDGPGRMVSRKADGSLDFITASRVYLAYNRYVEQFNVDLDVSVAVVARDTASGECGSPMIVQHPNCMVLAGIHCLGGQQNKAVGVIVTQQDVEFALEFFGVPPVDVNIPDLTSQAFTTNISPKCTARYLTDGVVQVFGSFGGFKRQPKSTAQPTPFTQYLLDRGHELKYGPAPMRGYLAVHHALKPMVQKTMNFKEDVMRICADAYVRQVVQLLPTSSFLELNEPLSLMAALNGVPGVKFIDSMNFSSSAGFPHNRSKRDFITRLAPEGPWQHPVVVNSAMKAEIAEIWNLMHQGVRCAPVFMQHLKDEALPLHKVAAGKARVFMGGPFAWSVCVRMLFLPFVRIMQLNKYLFEGAPGTNTTSIEWTRLYQYLTRFGADRCIAGDFKSYDKIMGSLVILEAFRIIIEICEMSGLEPSHLLAMQTVAEDTAFAFVNYNGDLMMFFGSNPSGHPLTVIINCIVNSLYMRYCYYELNPDHEVHTFRSNVALITYGDDNAMGSKVDWFNHTTVAAALASVGIVYTMADKESETVPFLNISGITFLKRSFRWDAALNAYAAKLDEDSIWKSMMIWIPSGEESPQKQALDIIRAAVSEWFFYGRERFEQETARLKEMVDSVGLNDYVEKGTFSTWEELMERFTISSASYLRTEPATTLDILGEMEWAEVDRGSMVSMLSPQGLVEESPTETKILPPCAVTARLLVNPRGMLFESVGTPGNSPERSSKCLFRQDPGWWSRLVDYTWGYRCNPGRKQSPANTLSWSSPDLQQNLAQTAFSGLSKQSLELEDGTQSMQRQENLMFADAGMGVMNRAPMVSYRPDGDSSAGLGDFLSRPVAIDTHSWAEGSTTIVQKQFKPWRLFFEKTAIKNKISNYARLRAKLHLKFVVNASPFYYGALRCCYCPLDGNKRDITESIGDQIKFSQLPGEFLYPADMTSTEMELPFLWPHSWISVGDATAFEDMGQMTYYLYSKLRSANGTTGQNVTITCYAWASDVELAGLTSGLAIQSDEYEDSGIISGPASAVAKVAGKLRDAPVIGGLARATEIGAKTLGGIASLFGYSNPPVIDDVHGFVPKSFHSFASVETGMPMDKLTIDPKNEITVDKTVTGAGPDDELVISRFCGRSSFITGFLWADTAAPGTQLMLIPVTPRNYAGNAGTSQTYVNETPACHAAAMFSQWRGGMVYTLRFVKSRYHTGRVQISWDPQTVPLTNAETTTLTRIVDLQLETEVTFTVPFKAGDPWLGTGNSSNNWAITSDGTISPSSHFNGYLRVTVLNELTGPAASQEVDILLFAHTAADFELAVPNELPVWSFLSVQSEDQEDGDMLAAGVDPPALVSTNAVTVGETVASLRTILHRTSYYHREFVGNPYSADGVFYTKGCYNLVNYIPRFPVEYGFTAQGVNYATGVVDPTKKQFQYSPNHPLGWIVNCFVGYRGSIVHQYNIIANGQALVDEVKVERDPRTHILDAAPRQAINRFSVGATTAQSSTLSRIPITTSLNVTRDVLGQRGMAITNTNTQSAVSVVTPQYSMWKFRPAFRDRRDVLGSSSEVESIKVVSTVRCGMNTTTDDGGWPILSVYMAGGVDFDPIYFMCVPTMYVFISPSPDNTY